MVAAVTIVFMAAAVLILLKVVLELTLSKVKAVQIISMPELETISLILQTMLTSKLLVVLKLLKVALVQIHLNLVKLLQ